MESEQPILPSGWITRRLEEICRVRTGGTPPKSEPAFWTGTFPWVSAKDLKRSRLLDSIDHITPEAASAYSEIAPAGSVLALVRGMGLVKSFAVSLIERPMAFNQDLKALIPSEGVSGAFLVHALTFASRRMLQNVTDAAHGTKRLSQEDLLGFEVPVPDVTEQIAIAAVLDYVVTAMEAETDALRKTQQLKAEATRQIFMRGLCGEEHKETEIGQIPHGWECVKFSAVREWLQYGTSVRCTTKVVGRPVLRIPNVIDGHINAADLKYCDLPDAETAGYALDKDDLLFVRTNGVVERLGACAVYQGTPSGAIFASYLIRARLKPVALPMFMAFFFGSEVGSSLVSGRATATADGKYNLNTAIIDSLPIPLPPTREEQQEIIDVLALFDQKIEVHQKKRAVLNDLFKSLLQKLMTGEIRVPELDLSALNRTTGAVSA